MQYKFNIDPKSRLGSAMGRVAILRFNNCKSNKEHRRWIDDVLDFFAYKIELSKSQVVQAIKTDSLESLQKAHERAAKKLPEYVTIVNEKGEPEKVSNPDRDRLLGYAHMQQSDYLAFIHRHLDTACGIRHPSDVVSKGGKTEEPYRLPEQAKKYLRHPDELHSAHLARMARALRIATGNATSSDLEYMARRWGLAAE